MANKSYKSTLAGRIGPVADPQAALASIGGEIAVIDLNVSDLVTTFIAKTAVDTAVGVLVADAGAPTQAHVNDLAAAWATFETAYDAGKAALNTLDTQIAALVVSEAAAEAQINANATFSVLSTATMNEVLVVLRAFEAQLRSTM